MRHGNEDFKGQISPIEIYYHHLLHDVSSSLKNQQDFFAAQKSFRALKNQMLLSEKVLFRVFIDRDFFRVFSDTVVFSVLSDRVLFGFLSHRVFFRFLSDKVFFRVLSDRYIYCVHSPLTPLFYKKKQATTILKLKTDDVFYIIFSKRRSHLSTTLACFNNFNKTDNEKCEEMYGRNTKCYIENIDHKLSNLQLVYIADSYIIVNYYTIIIHCIKKWVKTFRCFIWKPKITLFYLLSFVAICCTIRCHLLPFVVTHCTTSRHLMYHSSVFL